MNKSNIKNVYWSLYRLIRPARRNFYSCILGSYIFNCKITLKKGPIYEDGEVSAEELEIHSPDGSLLRFPEEMKIAKTYMMCLF